MPSGLPRGRNKRPLPSAQLCDQESRVTDRSRRPPTSPLRPTPPLDSAPNSPSLCHSRAKRRIPDPSSPLPEWERIEGEGPYPARLARFRILHLFHRRPLRTNRLGPARPHELGNLAIILQPDNRNIRSMRNPLRLDQRTVDSIEIPDEPDHLGQPANSMRLARPQNSRNCTPSARQSRSIHPDDQRGARQANIKTRDREIAIANPRVTSMRLHDQSSEFGNVIITPRRPPNRIETNHRRAHPLAKPSRKCSLAAPGASQHNDSRHAIGRLRLPPVRA
jgi:hypothetical protein